MAITFQTPRTTGLVCMNGLVCIALKNKQTNSVRDYPQGLGQEAASVYTGKGGTPLARAKDK